MANSSILFSPGSFSLPEFYDVILNNVRAKGYEIQCLHLPTVGLRTGEGREGAPATMYDDAAFIAKEAGRLADEGKDVILIGHSYGGIPVTESIKGLTTEERRDQKKVGGVIHLAYMTCLVPAVGEGAADVLANAPQEQQIKLQVDENGWLYHEAPEATAAIIMNHLPLEEATALVKKFPKHSATSFMDKLTYAGYKDVPVSYLVCEDDLCIPPQIQRVEIEMIERESGKKVHVTSIKADHCPNATAPQKIVDWILDIVERTANQPVVV